MSGEDEGRLFDAIEKIDGDPVVFSWNGQEYEGMFSPFERTEPLEPGGFMPTPTASLLATLFKFDRDGDLELRFGDMIMPGNNDKVTLRPNTDGAETMRVARFGEWAWDDINEVYTVREYDLISDDV